MTAPVFIKIVEYGDTVWVNPAYIASFWCPSPKDNDATMVLFPMSETDDEGEHPEIHGYVRMYRCKPEVFAEAIRSGVDCTITCPKTWEPAQ